MTAIRSEIRWTLAALVAALFSCSPALHGQVQPDDDPAWSFVVFIADDLGDGDLGCYGHPAVRTPHVDRLASQGARFTRAFLTISSCSPSRCSILTGRYPHSTGAGDLHEPLPADQRTIARELGAAGYFRGAVGKWHLGAAERAHWDAVEECGGAETEGRAVAMLEGVPRERPFFLWVASTDPHRPYQPGTVDPPHDPDRAVVPPYLPDHPDIRRELALYYDEITRFDACVGGVLEALDRTGRAGRTVVVFLSDNGMPFPRAKTTLYDSGIRTPFIVRWPGHTPPGMVQEHLFSVVDLAPTLLAIAGIELPEGMQGRAVPGMMERADAASREVVFAEANWHDFEKFTRAVRDERFKLIRNYYWDQPLWNSVDSINSITWRGLTAVRDTGALTPAQSFLFRSPRPFEEFYDLAADPHETRNRIDDPTLRADLERLRAALDAWREQTDDALPETRRPDGWTRDGNPLPHNQPWYDRWLQQGRRNQFETY